MPHTPADDVTDVETPAPRTDPASPAPPTDQPAAAQASPAPPIPEPATLGYAPVTPPYAAPAAGYADPALSTPPYATPPHDPAFGYSATPPHDPAMVAAPALAAPKGLAIAALVVGIVAFLIGWLPVVGAIAGVVAVVLGIVALVRRQSKGFAITGLVLGAIAFFTSIVISVVGLWIAANVETLAQLVEPSTPSVIVEGAEPADPETGGSEQPVPADGFATLDDAAFAALIAAPDDHVGENVVLFGEVQQLGTAGACDFLLTVHPAQQATWEGYAEWVLAFALSSEEPGTTCAETESVVELSHVQVWATVLGSTMIEFEDGPDDLVALDVHRVEFLPELP